MPPTTANRSISRGPSQKSQVHPQSAKGGNGKAGKAQVAEVKQKELHLEKQSVGSGHDVTHKATLGDATELVLRYPQQRRKGFGRTANLKNVILALEYTDEDVWKMYNELEGVEFGRLIYKHLRDAERKGEEAENSVEGTGLPYIYFYLGEWWRTEGSSLKKARDYFIKAFYGTWLLYAPMPYHALDHMGYLLYFLSLFIGLIFIQCV